MLDPDATETSLRAVIDCPGGGRCLMAGFPGLETGVDGTAYIDPETMEATLEAIAANGSRLLVVLAEEAELPEGTFPLLARKAAATGLTLAFAPIPDFNAPDGDTLYRLRDLLGRMAEPPETGGSIAFTCQHGAGRSGLMAAYILLRQGLPLDAAVTTVRAHFGEAIESEVQMQWLQAVSARLKDESATLDLDSDATHS